MPEHVLQIATCSHNYRPQLAYLGCCVEAKSEQGCCSKQKASSLTLPQNRLLSLFL